MLSELVQPELALPFEKIKPLDYRGGVIVYGAGKGGEQFAEIAAAYGVPVLFFCDDSPGRQGTVLAGRQVQGSGILAVHTEIPVVIALAKFQPVVERLRSLGVKRYCFSDDFLLQHVAGPNRDKWIGHFERASLDGAWDSIHVLDKHLEDEASRQVLLGLVKYRLSRLLGDLVVSEYPQYEHPVVRAGKNDVVLDCGAWIGDTAEGFARATGPYGRVYPFEPAPNTYAELCQNIKAEGLEHIVRPVNAGVGVADGEARFCTTASDSMGFCVSDGGDTRIEIAAIDSFCAREKVVPTLIKMDIEGSELDAINGGAETIRRHKPKLAICVYHKPGDLWEIPLRLRELNSGYRFYLGQHARGITETVLYAIDG